MNRPTADNLGDGIKLLRHIAIGGLSRSQFPSACAQALLNRLEALEVELRKYDPSLPSALPHESGMSTITSSDPFWDALDKVDAEGLVRECPNCHERPDDVKFAIHSKRIAGCDLSARCATCSHAQECDMSAAETLVRRWHAPKHLPQGGSDAPHG